ncbi:hypothetical protein BR63_02960 [Thermanaerosceptrum fracticalcis]|uniref:Uncharacterized protein n=1 Tax=Thermanaerosceptrum fracticalcis TaxID=1712410 RepID=A0A7G6DZV7_THEFR|nr:TrbC/VirB2 family protein [Thermanaerosceptrum fracticalcis]QNB45361.1 hypothetical protein BR63_02960 [Thermanaerosceptrum fracticalcis]
MKNVKILKLLSMVVLSVMFLSLVTTAALADNNTGSNNNIIDRINQAKGNDSISKLEKKANDVANSFVKFLRNTAAIIAVVMFILVAYSLLFSPDVRTISDCKGKVSALVLAIAVAVMAEEIVGTLLAWFQ